MIIFKKLCVKENKYQELSSFEGTVLQKTSLTQEFRTKCHLTLSLFRVTPFFSSSEWLDYILDCLIGLFLCWFVTQIFAMQSVGRNLPFLEPLPFFFFKTCAHANTCMQPFDYHTNYRLSADNVNNFFQFLVFISLPILQ